MSPGADRDIVIYLLPERPLRLRADPSKRTRKAASLLPDTHQVPTVAPSHPPAIMDHGQNGFNSSNLAATGAAPARATPSPAPSLPNVHPSSAAALQPGSMVTPTLPSGTSPSSLTEKGNDYVYFERRPQMFGESIMQKSTAAKMRLELYYKEAVEGVVARKGRRSELEKQLHQDVNTPDAIKARHLQALGRRESK